MKAEKPIIHGRDHAPGGADPIPGLSANLPWAFVRKVSISLASSSDNTYTNLDLDPATNDGGTDGSGVLTLGNGGGSGINGIEINEAGIYLWSISASAQTTGTPAAGSVLGIETPLDTGDIWGGAYYAPFYAVPGGAPTYNFGASISEFFNADAGTYSFPYVATVGITQNSGLTLSVLVTFAMFRISTITSTNFA